jgi:hypothetical protein
VAFSKDLDDVQSKLFAAGLSDLDRFEILRPWIARNQPCLFGKVAAKTDRLGFCIITEDDIDEGDKFVREKIQRARLQWKRDALRGRKSGFIISVQTLGLVRAAPEKSLQDFAIQLTKLYLSTDIAPAVVYLDQVMYRETADDALAWRVGANFFASAGDGRWWHDHRFPGGIALSMNSVGHMTHAAAKWPPAEVEGAAPMKPETLGESLRFAMQTIALAHNACSGVATWLLDRPADEVCPHADDSWPANIKGRSRRDYKGWYHTDHTIPGPYFGLDQARPGAVDQHDLDFTYLWDDSDDNLDHQTMGVGEKVPL